MNTVHRVYIIKCPKCKYEKTKVSLRKRCLLSYTCKKCKHVCDPNKHTKRFRFCGIIAENSKNTVGILNQSE